MKTRTEIQIEYVPAVKKATGRWWPVTIARFRSQERAEKYFEEAKDILAIGCEISPEDFKAGENYKIKKRTVITTISEWEDV